MTAGDPSGWRETFHRWTHENVADTRRPGRPEPRVYAVAFARVWDELLEEIDRRSRWTLVHSDEELGLITVECRSRVFRLVDDLTIWVALDPNGLTRVDVLSRARKGQGDLGVNRRRVEGLLGKLDGAFGPSARLVDRREGEAGRTRGSPEAGGPE